MARIAVLSDVNGNLEALEAVLQDVARVGVSAIVFLGDAIGYGADSLACLAKLRNATDIYLRGRLETRVISAGIDSDIADNPVFATCSPREIAPHVAWLSHLPTIVTAHGATFVHGDPRGPSHECLLCENIRYGITSVEVIYSQFETVLMIGDNHQAWVYGSECGLHIPRLGTEKYLFGQEKSIVSVGSVGLPRDGDPRACYVVADATGVEWRRVDYDLDTAVAKIRSLDKYVRNLPERLQQGV